MTLLCLGSREERKATKFCAGFNCSANTTRCSILTVPVYLTETEMCGVHHQKLYADTYERMAKLELKRLIGKLRVFVNYCAEDKLVVQPNEKASKVVEATLQ